MTPEIAMSWSSKQILDWRNARNMKSLTHNQVQENRPQYTNGWLALDQWTLKLNVDASVFEDSDSFSVGMVVRNHQDMFLHVRTMKFAGRVEVLEAELVAVLEAIKWTSSIQGHIIYVESDSLLSVQTIKENVQII